MKVITLPLCAAALLLAACRTPISSRACTANYVFGLSVTVVDSTTGGPPASALLIARNGAFVDSVGPREPVSYVTGPFLVLDAAGEREGTYDVTVRAQGYRNWTRTGVRVTAGECHVHPVALTARLQH